MSDKTFNTLRFLAERGIPALAVLIASFGTIFAIEFAAPVALFVAAIGVFVGQLVADTRKKYEDGE